MRVPATNGVAFGRTMIDLRGYSRIAQAGGDFSFRPSGLGRLILGLRLAMAMAGLEQARGSSRGILVGLMAARAAESL